MRLRDKEERVQSFLKTERKDIVITLVIKGQLKTTFATSKQLRVKTTQLLYDITVRCVLREVGLGA